MKRIREKLTPVEIQEMSHEIKEKLFHFHLFMEAYYIAVYCATKNEVDTTEIIKDCLTLGKKVVVPCFDGDEMNFCHVDQYEDLTPGKYNILEIPKENRKYVELNNIGIIILPAIAVDTFGTRVGFGGGYYDRRIKDFTNIKIALTYDFQIVEIIEPDRWDVPVDAIISEKRMIRVNV